MQPRTPDHRLSTRFMTHHLVARNPAELQIASSIAGLFVDGKARHRFTTAGRMRGGEDGSTDGHALMPRGIDPSDDLVLGPSLVTFDSPMHLALVGFWASFVPNGRICVPESPIGGGLRLERLVEALGPTEMVRDHEGRRYAMFRGRSWKRSGTVVDWWAARRSATVLAHLDVESRDLDVEALDARWPAQFLPAGDDADRRPERPSEEEVGSIWSYQLWAASAKVSVLRWILRECAIDGEFDHVDVGPGPGLVGAELLLDPTTGVRRSTGLELRAIGPWSGCRLAGPDRDALGDRWRFRLGSASRWRGTGGVGLVTALGSLLYLPRSEAIDLLDRAWDVLLPGGLLVVHENIRHPRFVVDHDLMFAREELDAMLDRYGRVEHFAATACRRLTPEQAGEKTVFRVVVKNR